MKIEEAMSNVLNSETQVNALELISFLRNNKMNPAHTSKNGWKISSKACVVCYIWLDSDTETLTLNPFIGEYDQHSLSNDLKEIVWSNKTQGPSCGGCHVISGSGYNCSYKINTVFGKKYDDACARSIVFKNPNSEEIECIKKLLLMRKNTIKNGKRLPTAPTNYGPRT